MVRPFEPYHDENEPLMKDDLDRNDAVAGAGAGAGTGTSTVTEIDHPDAPLESPVGVATNNGHGATLEVIDDNSSSDGSPPTPRFIQDERSSKRWKKIPYPVRRVLLAIAKWSRGPANAQPFRIKPLFPVVQEYPLYLVERFLPKAYRVWVLFLYFSIWLITFVLVKRQETVASTVEGWGQSQPISCGDTYWSAGNGCGLDGNDCRPFNGSGFAFQCPASCESYHVLNPRAVGDQEVIYRPLVIGGPTSDVNPDLATYRGDSYICASAIHAGLFLNSEGGCGVVELVGQQQEFVSSQRNGITSIGFDSYFPLSFRFVPDIKCTAKDERWSLLAVSAVFTGVLSLFTASPALFFFPTFTGMFFTVGISLDQPGHSTVTDLFSNILGKYLPAMFCAWVMYDKMGVRRTLNHLTAQVEKTVLWLGACWVGALTNYTLDFIPIQRLNKHDLDQQPGARAALATIVIILFFIVLSQVWFFRQEGRFIKYIKLYALFIFGIVISLTLPGLQLRLHHYILGLLLLPGTSLQTRPSLLYQGLLVGLFINGIARWGFDPVLETPAALQGDAQKGSLLPTIPPPVIYIGEGQHSTSNITFTWNKPVSETYDGISILVNDVERFRGYFDDIIDRQDSFIWSRNGTLGLPEYFRFAYMQGSSSGDYTRAGIWSAEGEWTQMKPGPSRVKARSADDHRVRR
ncbi:lccl domain containing [Trichoderma cornu-damae]|uniref:Lccl domain containing n=1 Tax=Trichoderma cornu-damae TaxID=654480 RepID=A0A9P8QWM5_9HYPO|nr:lccl domain containing [Trichoderma cornu-damae]